MALPNAVAAIAVAEHNFDSLDELHTRARWGLPSDGFTTSRGAQRCRAAYLSPRQAPPGPANGLVGLPNSCDHRRMRIEQPDDLAVADQHLIQQIADTAEADVRLLIPQLPEHITLAVLIAGRYVIPATGDGGISLARGKLARAVDASRSGGIAGGGRAAAPVRPLS